MVSRDSRTKKNSLPPIKQNRGKSLAVRQYILDTFSPGDWLPPEHDIAKSLQVTRYAVTRALNDLHSQGQVVREPGRGTKYTGARQSPDRINPQHTAKTYVFISTELSSVLAIGLISALERELGERNCRLALRSTDHKSSLEMTRIGELQTGGFSGAIIVSDNVQQIQNEILRLHEGGFPLVLMDRLQPGLRVPSVATDHFAGAVAVVSHLISLGHKRIAHITFGGVWHESHAVKLRHEGYQFALRSAGIQPEDSLIAYLDLPEGNASPDTQRSELSAYIAMHKLLASQSPPTAVFAVNDFLCEGIVLAATNHGLKIPDQLSLAGFDYDAYIAPNNLSLTTYAHPIKELAHAAAEILLASAAGLRPSVDPVVIPGRLVLGNSTSVLSCKEL